MEVIVGKTYKHFKGNTYKVIAVAKSCDDLRPLVVYQDIADESKVWVRNFEEFISLVDKDKYPAVKQEHRFEMID